MTQAKRRYGPDPEAMLPCEITVEDGTVISGRHELDLAWKWAEHANAGQWATMHSSERAQEAYYALAALREGRGA